MSESLANTETIPEMSRRLDELDRRLESLEASIALLTTRISCANGEVYVTGPLNVSIPDPFIPSSSSSLQPHQDLPCRIRS